MIVFNIETTISNYKKLKRDFKIRKSANYTEFVYPSGKRVFQNESDKFRKGLFLFRMVKSDIKKYLLKYGEVEPYENLPVNYRNEQYNDKDGNVIGIDIDNAYWRIAYLKDYISENTYLKGIEKKKELKPVRLSALSSLGRARTYEVYQKGVYVFDEIHSEQKNLQNIYNDIRFSTYGVMYECSQMLGNDFHSWRTDCINFKDTPENRKKVIDTLEMYNLDWKVEST